MRRLRWYGLTGIILGGALFPVAAAWACLPVASLNTSSATAQPGGQITVTGAEFGSNPVDIHFNSITGPVLATFTPNGDANGTFSGAVTIPANASPGTAILVATEDAASRGSAPGAPARALVDIVGPGGAPLAPAGGVAARPVSPLVTSSVSTGGLVLVALGALGVALLVAASVAMVGTRRGRPAAEVVKD